MSHNLVKIDSQESTRTSDISLSLETLTTSPTTYDILEYSNPNWSLTNYSPSPTTLSYTKYYSTSPAGPTNYSYSTGDYFVWRTRTTVQSDEYLATGTTAQAASSSTSPFTSNGTWKQSITLTISGTYLFILRPAFGNSFASNDSCTIEMYDSSASFSNKLHVNTAGKFGDCLFGIKTIAASTVFKFIVSDLVGTVDVLESTAGQFLAIQVLKLS